MPGFLVVGKVALAGLLQQREACGIGSLLQGLARRHRRESAQPAVDGVRSLTRGIHMPQFVPPKRRDVPNEARARPGIPGAADLGQCDGGAQPGLHAGEGTPAAGASRPAKVPDHLPTGITPKHLPMLPNGRGAVQRLPKRFIGLWRDGVIPVLQAFAHLGPCRRHQQSERSAKARCTEVQPMDSGQGGQSHGRHHSRVFGRLRPLEPGARL